MRRLAHATVCLGVAAAMLAVAACPPKKPPFPPGTVKPHQLPSDANKLVAFAKKRMGTRFHRLRWMDAVVALQKASRLKPRNQIVLLLGVRVAHALAERAQSKGDKHKGEQLKFADIGRDFAKLGVKHHGGRVEFHYYLGVHLGLRLDAYRLAASSLLPKIRHACRAAIKIDQRYDHAGPLRLLGAIQAQAPETAPFNGDLDEGIQLLERAVALAPTFPLNHYFLALSYAKDDEDAKAVAHYRKVVCAPVAGPWISHLARRYRGLATKALRKLGKPARCP